MLKKRKKDKKYGAIGHYSFLVGALFAILTGIFSGYMSTPVIVSILVVLGIIVGILNITVKETKEFLIATIALMLAGAINLGIIPYVGLLLRSILSNIVVFVVPAAVIVALKTIYNLAKEK